MPQGSGAARGLWGFGQSGGAGEVRARRVERYVFRFGRMSRPVPTSALLVAGRDRECSCLRIERMNASPDMAGGEPAKTNLVVIFDPQ